MDYNNLYRTHTWTITTIHTVEHTHIHTLTVQTLELTEHTDHTHCKTHIGSIAIVEPAQTHTLTVSVGPC